MRMCRWCQSCFEDCYWYCIEERFCFDKNIAGYNADEDEYFAKKGSFRNLNIELTDRPICEQPGRDDNPILRAKIHEEDYRQIQTNVPFLAPEILAVFANSQIFHDSQPNKSLAIVHKSPTIIDDNRKNSRNIDTEKKLLKRLQGADSSDEDSDDDKKKAAKSLKPFFLEEEASNSEVILCPMRIIKASSKSHSDLNDDDEDVMDNAVTNRVNIGLNTPILNKRLRNIQQIPYFSFRHASENDIFTIAGNSGSQISMTPEIPPISYTNLPKNYEDTPTIEKYKESVSLHSIQTSNIERAKAFDFSMPRYFGKSEIIAQSADNLAKALPPKKVEKSKRLKLLRANLPPLSIHISREKSKERNIE